MMKSTFALTRLASILVLGACAAGCLAEDAASPDESAEDSFDALQDGQRASLRGQLEISVADDFVHHSARNLYFLKTSAGEHVELTTIGDPLLVQPSGKTLVVSGVRRNKSFVVDPKGVESILAGTQTPTTSAPLADLVDGQRSVAVVLYNFRNDTSTPISVDQARQDIFTGPYSPAPYWAEASYGRVQLVEGGIFGWVTIDADNTGCDVFPWSDKAKEALKAQGVNLDNYAHTVFVPNHLPGCGWAGLGTVGGGWSTVPTDFIAISSLAHELGHNFGLQHAMRDDCNDNGAHVPFSGTCQLQAYADTTDVMGYAIDRPHHTSVHNKAFLGWLDDRLQTVTQSGEYTIAPTEVKTSAVQALRIARPGTNDYFWLEYRRPSTMDNFSSDASVVNGVLIHAAAEGSVETALIDNRPDTGDIMDAALLPGMTFTDPVTGIKIETVSADDSEVRVRITLPGSDPGGSGGGGVTKLVAPSGKCLDVSGAGTADGTKIQLWTCNGTGAQSFRAEDLGNGAYRFVNTNSNKCVDVSGAGTADGTQVQLWSCNGTGAQSFQRQDVGGGYSRFVNTNSAKCLDINAAGTADGTKIQIWSCNSSDAQRWNLTQ